MSTDQHTLFWYDLETSGVDPRRDRIMQFAGQRTDMNLEPIGEPVNMLIRLSDDVLPQPDAILITGITPQMTLADGVTEAEFLRFFAEEIAVKGTVFAGFNSVRFDDEFMRFLHWRNYYDPYGWQWRDDRGRWDILDVVRMTRALRPEGITWPNVQGAATNRLELLTKVNGIAHEAAHDALSDVYACIAVARLIREKQPKLFQYLFDMRDKKKVAELVERNEPFVYTSGKYDKTFAKTTVAVRLASNPHAQGRLVYDLRHSPAPFFSLTPAELVERWRWTRDEKAPARLPVKTLQYNRCPAIAPLAVLDAASQERLSIDPELAAKHRDMLRDNPQFVTNVLAALERLEVERAKRTAKTLQGAAETRLYDGGFISDDDMNIMSVLRAARPTEFHEIAQDFHDERLRQLLLPYKARNYPAALSDEERSQWEAYRYEALMAGGATSSLARFMHRLAELAAQSGRADRQYILEELRLYAESSMPIAE